MGRRSITEPDREEVTVNAAVGEVVATAEVEEEDEDDDEDDEDADCSWVQVSVD